MNSNTETDLAVYAERLELCLQQIGLEEIRRHMEAARWGWVGLGRNLTTPSIRDMRQCCRSLLDMALEHGPQRSKTYAGMYFCSTGGFALWFRPDGEFKLRFTGKKGSGFLREASA